MDRQGDDLEPTEFDIQKFMENPQLWYDHKKWLRPDGNEVNAGLVRKMAVVRAIPVADQEGAVNVADLFSESVIDTLKGDDVAIAKVGQTGVWVEAEVMEPGIVELLDQGRINSFSFVGVRKSNDSGLPVIEVEEVSLVYLPANSDARFIIAKSWDSACQLVRNAQGFFRSLLDGVDSPDVDDATDDGFSLLAKRADGTLVFQKTECPDADAAERMANTVFAFDPTYERVLVLKSGGITKSREMVYDVVRAFTRVFGKAKWSAAYQNKLPDSCFAYIEPGGEKDADGRTTPRSKRHFPIRDMDGKLDRAHVQNAMARMSQSEFGEKARSKIESAARELGMSMGSDEKKKGIGAGDAAPNDLEGGDIVSKEELDALMKSVATMATQLTQVTEVVKGLEARIAKSESTTTDPVVDEAAATAAAAAAESAKAAESVARTEGAAAAEASAVEEVAKSVKALTENVTTLVKSVDGVSTRIEKLEKSAQTSRALDGDTPKTTKKPLTAEDRRSRVDALLNTVFTEPLAAG